MTDTTVNAKVYLKQGGDELVVASGGSINIESGGTITVGGTQGAALTTQLSTITIADAAGTPDYALQAVINTNAYGLASAAEMITLLYVIKNLQTRLAEVEARLEGAGIVAAN